MESNNSHLIFLILLDGNWDLGVQFLVCQSQHQQELLVQIFPLTLKI